MVDRNDSEDGSGDQDGGGRDGDGRGVCNRGDGYRCCYRSRIDQNLKGRPNITIVKNY